MEFTCPHVPKSTNLREDSHSSLGYSFSGFRVQGSGFRVQSSGFWVQGSGPTSGPGPNATLYSIQSKCYDNLIFLASKLDCTVTCLWTTLETEAAQDRQRSLQLWGRLSRFMVTGFDGCAIDVEQRKTLSCFLQSFSLQQVSLMIGNF